MKTNNSIFYVVTATTSDIYDDSHPYRDLNIQTDEDYPISFTSKEEAENQYVEASKLSHDYGRELNVELWKLDIPKEVLNYLEDEDDVYYYVKHNFTEGELMLSDTFDNNKYEPLAGGVVLTWNWHRYIGYARNFVGVEWGDNIYNYSTKSYATTERDLITSNVEYTNSNVSCLVIKAKELQGMTDQDIAEYIINEIMSDKWKWNYQHAPSAAKISSLLSLNVDDE